MANTILAAHSFGDAPPQPLPPPPPQPLPPTVAQIYAATLKQVALPSCISQKYMTAAQQYCALQQAQKNAALNAGKYQSAVAGYRYLRGFGDDPTIAELQANPCAYAQLAVCPSASPSPSSAVQQMPADSIYAVAPASAAPVPAAAPLNKELIIGGVVVAAVALGGLYLMTRKH